MSRTAKKVRTSLCKIFVQNVIFVISDGGLWKFSEIERERERESEKEMSKSLNYSTESV